MKLLIEKIKNIATFIYYKESNRDAIKNLNESKDILAHLKNKLLEEEL